MVFSSSGRHAYVSFFQIYFFNAAAVWFFGSWKMVKADRCDGNQVHYLGPTRSLPMNS